MLVRRVCLALCAIAVPALAAADAVVPTLHIPRVSQPPALHAFVGEEAPGEFARVSGFRQREPQDGELAAMPTTAYVGYDDVNLYVVFVCIDDPARVRAHLSRREDVASDDVVSVSLDTFHDGRHAYVFFVNPLGVQLDAIATEGLEDDNSFDARWHSEGRVTPTGFVVVMTIPFRTLRYKDADVQTWGIAFGRYRPAARELATWPHLTSTIDAYIPQFAVAGLERLPRRAAGEVRPYAAAGSAEQRVGADVKAVIGTNWVVDATANPDFSEVESDEPQVTANRRFEVFFPERRPFFTDRASFFDTPEPLFFSRRIASPVAGARVTGVTGNWTTAALVADDRTAAGREPSVVGRLQRRMGEQSTVGTLVTTRAGNQVASFDARLVLTPNWSVTTQVAHSSDDEASVRHAGTLAYVEVRHAGRHLTYYSNYRDRSPDFHASLGYVPRVDMRQMKHAVGYKWRPHAGPITSAGPSALTLLNWDHAGLLQDASIDLPFWVEFKGPASLAIGQTRALEHFAGIDFHERSTYLYAQSDARRWLGVEANWSVGTRPNYQPAPAVRPLLGTAMDTSLGVTVRPSSRLRLAGSYVVSSLEDGPQRVSVSRSTLWRSKTTYQFTRAWSLRAIVDYDGESGSAALTSIVRRQSLVADVLATFMPQPGEGAYVGFMTSRQDGVAGWQLFAKVMHTLQF